MASFPVFLDVSTVPPLIVGGGELALIKARLLLKRAARITFATVNAVPGIHALAAEGKAEILADAPDSALIAGRPLVISATQDDVEDGRVSALARQLGVPVNVPDRPELCTLSLPAIVDRGEVTVAIGTEGAAPVLATELRARLEQELHPRLGRLAEVARTYREEVAERLEPGPQRRAFWQSVFNGPAADAILAGDESTGNDLIAARLSNAEAAGPPAGRVLLVGAGPGDPDLLTLKAVRALKSADVILYDGLVGDGVLEYARREAQTISVAKARGRHSKTQAEINALMVAFARDGKTVVRLKGGDPFIFGRGGEELDCLRASGIPVEVVPGITAAVAAAASLQIPLTHRDISHSVTFVSGHAAGDGASDFDQVEFGALASGQATLAVYMGLATARALAEKLIASGWRTTTPVIAVERASQARERRVATTLAQLSEDPKRLGLDGPTLLLIGEVAALPSAGHVTHVDRQRIEHTEPAYA
ncbi:siroheme synthase CysG [Leptospira interrogans]